MKEGRKMRKAKLRQLFIVVALAFVLILATPLTQAAAGWMESGNLSKNGMFSNPYTSLEEVLTDARAKHEEVVDEGTALLKNNGILPLNAAQTGSNKITVFNSAPALTQALEGVGFSVNDVSPQSTTTSGQEGVAAKNSGVATSFTSAQEKSMKDYSDVAVVRIFRTAGEGNDLSTGRSLLADRQGYTADHHFGDITWVNKNTKKIVKWNKADYEAGLLLEAWPDGTAKGWNHKNLAPAEPLGIYGTDKALADRDETPVRHALMLTQDEEKMIQIAKAKFDNVIVVYDSVTQFELWDLEHDEGIDAIIHSGRMTTTSVNNPSLWAGRGIARIISGQVNPSAYLVSQWDRDMTADPTWQNFGDNLHNDSSTTYQYSDGTTTGPHTRNSGFGGGPGLHGVDYEEGIYLGYKYYETYWHETAQGNTATSVTRGAWSEANQAAADAWHYENVTYPFGYGLTYADFKYEITGVNMVGSDEIVDGGKVNADLFESTASADAKVKTINVTVKVTNEDTFYAGKAVAQIYATTPYVGEVEKPFVKLVGFDKTRYLNPGQSDTLVIPVEVQDIASFDYDGRSSADKAGYILDAGEYVLRAMNSSSVLRSTCYDDLAFTVENADNKAVNLVRDDYSGNEVDPIFSTPNTREYTIRDTNIMASGGTGMSILSRSDMDGTFPEAPTYKDLRLDDNYIDDYVRSETSYVAGYSRERSSTGLTTAKTDYTAPANANAWYYDAEKGVYEYLDDESDPWYISRAEFDAVRNANTGATWTQAAQSVRDADTTGAGTAIKLREMSGKKLYMADGTINPEWDRFMNQLTYLELQIIASDGNSALARIDAIDKNQSAARDNTSVLASIYHWGDQPLLSRTWNTDLCADHGRLTAQYAAFGSNAPTGWWSPGCNLHRSPFSGRNGDYYGQDAVQAGLIIAAVTEAAEDNGLACWIKHFILNDQETHRNGYGLFTWGDEQTFRENYFPYAQKAFQEGKAQGNMQSFARIGGVVFAYSYEANTELMRNQWGWTGTSVTDMLAGQVAAAFTVPEKPANWFDAGAAFGEDGDKNKALDTTKQWIGGRTVTLDQLVRGAQGLPDANNGRSSIFKDGKYVNTINSWNPTGGKDGTGAFENDTGTTVPKTTTVQASTNANPVSGIWSEKMEGGKGGVYLEHEAGKNTAAVMDVATATMTTSGYHQWYGVRMTAMYACYESANSRGNENGMLINDNTNQLRNYHGTTYGVSNLKQGTAVSDLSVAITDPTSFTFNKGTDDEYTYSNSVVYSVVSGELPAGLTLNASTGAITGTPRVATTAPTVVTVECRVANYLYGNKTVTIAPIASAISLSKTDAVAGTAFSADIVSADLDGDKTYSVVSGELPEGLTIADGKISGTPAYAGTYNFTLGVTMNNVTYETQMTVKVATPTGLTTAQVEALITAATSDKLTAAQVEALIAAATSGQLTQAQVEALITAATSDKLTQTQVQELITTATSGQLTEADVQKLIDDANAEGGCGSAITFGGVFAILAAFGLAFVIVRHVKAKKKD